MEHAATIVVVPRERFGAALTSLASVLAHSPPGTPLVYVDGGSPRHVRHALERAAVEHGFEHVRSGRYLSPNLARNIGLRNVRTPYVIFVDNDVVVAPGWVEALVSCANETNAALVGPLCLREIDGRGEIHVAGGEAHFVDDDGRRVLSQRCYHEHAQVGSVLLQRMPSEMVEFHAMLARVDVLRALGPLDEGLLSVNEHADLCLQVRERGDTIYFEPASVVTYMGTHRLAPSDVPYFMLRWSEEWVRSSVLHFNEKWHADPKHPRNYGMIRWVRHYRARGLGLVRDGKRRGAGWLYDRLAVRTERMFNHAYTKWAGRSANARS